MIDLKKIYMKKIIYNIIRYPLILIFIKTPLINILKIRFKKIHFNKKRNLIWSILDTLFQKEYFNKLRNYNEIRELTNSTLVNGQGRKWAEYYYNNHFQTLDALKKRRAGTMSSYDAEPIFKKIINFIKSNNLSNNKNTYIIQLGSSSGRDLEFFLKIFPKLNYISTDVNNEILDFQKEKYNYLNLKYFKCYAEDIDRCIDYFKISDKNIILFSIGSLQYVNFFFLKEFFSKIKNYKNLNLFISEPVSLKFFGNSDIISHHRGNTSFSHPYNQLIKKLDINIVESKLIKPYEEVHKQHVNTGHFYVHVQN